MKSFSIIVVAVSLLMACRAHETQSGSSKMKPSQWLSSSQLEQTPSVEEISLVNFEKMSVEEGADIIEKIYHISQIKMYLRPTFVPSSSNIPTYMYKKNGQKISTTLDKMVASCKLVPQLGEQEITIFITGYPSSTDVVKKANSMLIEAYIRRYNMKRHKPVNIDYSGEKMKRTSSEEDSSEWQRENVSNGNLVVIDLGAKLNSYKRIVLLDTQKTGAMMASVLMEMTEKCNVVDDTMHIVGQGIAAHVAGAIGDEYTRHTGRHLRRITALDPSKMYAKEHHTLSGLARGAAEFVDAIHTNVYGLGTIERVGDVDFYPNGPCVTVPGATNIVEASMRATRYYAETVMPGNEYNFPAVAAKSFQEYKNNDGYGKRVYMGINCEFDVEGDYIMAVNPKSPFGQRAPAKKQNTYHGVHKPMINAEEIE